MTAMASTGCSNGASPLEINEIYIAEAVTSLCSVPEQTTFVALGVEFRLFGKGLPVITAQARVNQRSDHVGCGGR